MSPKKMIGVRQGCKPLVFGELLKNNYVLASEDCALKEIEAENITELLPGEMISITEKSVKRKIYDKDAPKGCSFENIYKTRPDSTIFEEKVSNFRINTGKELAKEEKLRADKKAAKPTILRPGERTETKPKKKGRWSDEEINLYFYNSMCSAIYLCWRWF